MLVYPGGAREAWKRTTDKPYEILWGCSVQDGASSRSGETGGK